MADRLSALAACAMTLSLAVTFGLYEWISKGRAILDEGPPDFSDYYAWRSLALAGCAAVIVFLVQRAAQPGQSHSFDRIGGIGRVAILACGGIAIASASLFALSPYYFSHFSLEDRLVEWSSATALFLGTGFALLASFRAFRARARTEGTALCVFAGLLFVIGMEEISWLQRVIGFQTPSWMPPGNQGEVNIHNQMISTSENLYYTGAVCFLVALPFANDFMKPGWRPDWLGRLVPTRTTVLVAAPMAGFTWDMWNVIPIQLGVFLTLFVLVAYAAAAIRDNDSGRLLVLFILLATLLPLVLFLWLGSAQIRWWDSTEYKELFIALGLLSAAMGMAFAKRKRA